MLVLFRWRLTQVLDQVLGHLNIEEEHLAAEDKRFIRSTEAEEQAEEQEDDLQENLRPRRRVFRGDLGI